MLEPDPFHPLVLIATYAIRRLSAENNKVGVSIIVE
jgi:hypothetical protein